VSCVLTGSHAIVDVLGGVGLGWLSWHHDRVWQVMVRAGERAANSWSCLRVGPVRIISHAPWSALAATAGALLTLHLAGPSALVPCAVALSAGFVGAGAWGHALEGGGRLSRPFGYYGFLLGTLSALVVMALAGVESVDRLVAGLAAAAPVAQGIGRVRCIVQGCCHGRRLQASAGFRVVHPMSRVVALGGLAGVPIHPTPLYSVVGNGFLALVLLRLWSAGADWTLIAGLYLVLSSLARFVEEQYRGEPQTARPFGLPIYQWLAIAFAVSGVLLSTVHGAVVRSAHWQSALGWALAVATGCIATLLMSVDFPASARRFSRLTVGEAPPPRSQVR
jgi:hypothetical protein